MPSRPGSKVSVVRFRALPLLLALTGGDYALWDWSIADGHDLLSLLSGLTLLPLAAASLALLAVGVARLLGFALARPPAHRRPMRERALSAGAVRQARAQGWGHAAGQAGPAGQAPRDSTDDASRRQRERLAA